MFELPIRAFLISGYDESIELTINEVWGFPDETAYGGGYGAKGTLEIHAGSYQAIADHYFTTGELFKFKEELKKCYQELSGKAELKNTESALELSISFTERGHIIINGCFQERQGVDTKLRFEIGCDQSFIPPAIKDLEKIEMIFGNMEGIKK